MMRAEDSHKNSKGIKGVEKERSAGKAIKRD
jgi:hypothetical protein